jgi:alcohol dehydrogenase class IV
MLWNLASDLKRFAAVASAMGEKMEGGATEEAAHVAVEAVKRLIGDLGLPMRLRDIEVGEDLPTLQGSWLRNILII